jgi:hypothetical protein
MSIIHAIDRQDASEALFKNDRDTLVQVTQASFCVAIGTFNAHPTPEGRYHLKLGYRSVWHDLTRGRAFIGASWGIGQSWGVPMTYFVTEAFFDANRRTLIPVT